MEHATALVDHDATTTTCHCHKMRAAGWTIRCYACGAGFEDGAVSRFADALYLEVEAEDRLRERGERIRAAGPLVDEDDRARDDQLVDQRIRAAGPLVDEDDRARDDQLVDEAEGRAA